MATLPGLDRPKGHGRRAGPNGPVTILDMGTSKICCFVGRPLSTAQYRVLGRGYQLADGLRCGEVIDADAAEISIQAALHEAEQQLKDTIRSVVAIVGGGRPRSLHLHVERALEGRVVSDQDLIRVLRRARSEASDPSRAVLHAVPVEASIDGGRALRDPRGLSGDRLQVLVHVVVVDRQPLRTILSCLERCHVEVRQVMAAPYAAALGAVSPDEMERGCLAIDIGAGVTQIAHCADGRVVFVDQIPEGGDGITAEVAQELSTSRREAERLKTLHGSVQPRACDDNVRLAIPLIGDIMDMPTGEVALTRLTSILRNCTKDLLGKVIHSLREGGDVLRARPPRSVVLTGGSAQIEGIDELAEEIFGLPARVGRPRGLRSATGEEADTSCSAAAGCFALFAQGDDGLGWNDGVERGRVADGIARLTQWMKQNF